MEHMTALISAFARSYHYRHHSEWIFADRLAEKMLTEEEYAGISRNMSEGISYFAPGFKGSKDDALRLIVDHQLAPPVLARSAFCERAIDNAVRIGCDQIVLFACGYDTFALRTENRKLTVFELDRPEMMADKQKRIARGDFAPLCRVESIGCDLSRPFWKEELIKKGFDVNRRAFGSLLGISYYLSNEDFARLINWISALWREGSSICFDYPFSKDGSVSRRGRELAAAAGEPMKAVYSYDELEDMLSEAGFLIYEHLNDDEATEAFFQNHNIKESEHRMEAPDGIGYCLAVKKRAEK